MNRRLITLIIVLLLIALGAAGFFYYSVQQVNNTNQDSSADQQTSVTIKKVVDASVISPIAAFNNQSIWYFTVDGRLYKINPDGTNPSEFPLPSIPGSKLLRALWPKTGEDFLAISTTGSKDIKSYYDSKSRVFINLSDNIKYMDWLPDSKRIIYVWQAGDKYQVVTANADGSGYKVIKDLPSQLSNAAVKVNSDGKMALLYQTGGNAIHLLNLDTGELTEVITNGKYTGAAWLPKVNKFLYGESTSLGPKIMLADIKTTQITDLNLNTILDKIVIDPDGKFIYGAVAKQDNSGDDFMVVDLTTSSTGFYYEPHSSVNVKNLMLVGNILYYTDQSGKLYYISK